MFRNKLVLEKAASQIGVLEIKGKGSNKQVEEYHKYSTIKNLVGMTDDVPWCASFVAWCLEKVGMGSTNSKMARSYEKWGVSSKADPLPGDIVIFWRKSLKSGYGHVGFFVKETKDHVYVLGGNQGDEVNVTRYSKARMRDIRRSSKAGEYSIEQKHELHTMAQAILDGRPVGTSDKVV